MNNKNNEYGKNLSDNKQNAKAILLSNQIAKLCDDFKYDLNRIDYDNKCIIYNKEKDRYDKLKDELENIELKLKDLKNRTTDESIAAEKINDLLKKLGNKSFSLETFSNCNQEGQYRIKGWRIKRYSNLKYR